MNIENFTTHSVVWSSEAGDRVFPPSGKVARVGMSDSPVAGIQIGQPLPNSVVMPAIQRTPTGVTELGECFCPRDCSSPLEDCDTHRVCTGPCSTIYIVSSMALEHYAGRTDVFAPDTGPTAIRNEKGQIVAVTRFVMAPSKQGA